MTIIAVNALAAHQQTATEVHGHSQERSWSLRFWRHEDDSVDDLRSLPRAFSAPKQAPKDGAGQNEVSDGAHRRPENKKDSENLTVRP